jgi:hypothetical protein
VSPLKVNSPQMPHIFFFREAPHSSALYLRRIR